MNYLSSSFYYRFAQFTPIAVFILMMLGSYVKAINAGLACPDWPLCYGQIIPLEIQNTPYSSSQIMAEFIHRLFALVVSILIIFLLFLSFYHRNNIFIDKEFGKKRFHIMLLVNVLLIIQVLFGAFTVLLELEPTIVSIHLGFATAIFGATIFHLSLLYRVNLQNKTLTKPVET